MLLVNARAGVSAIHGIGLIAREFIPRGSVVWELRSGFDLVLAEQQVQELSDAAREQVLWYAYYDPAKRVYVLSADDDRFTNHADDPNTANDGNVTFATRDIRPGEEITWDYRPWSGVDFPIGASGDR
jgi:SET domain-containing protein